MAISLSKQYAPIWIALKTDKYVKVRVHKSADISAVRRVIKRFKYEDTQFKSQCLEQYGYCLELDFSEESTAGNEDYVILLVQLVDKIDKINNILL